MAVIKDKCWTDPVGVNDGLRILVSHYWPKGLKRAGARWHDWLRPLAPSKHLHAARSARLDPPISFETFRRRYDLEMESREPRRLITMLARLLLSGRSLTLVCLCENEGQCHRGLLRKLVEAEAVRLDRARREVQCTGGVDVSAVAGR